MALGLLPGDRDYYHRSGAGAPLWAACCPQELRERVTQGAAHRLVFNEAESVLPFLQRGLKPCPRCWPKERVSNG